MKKNILIGAVTTAALFGAGFAAWEISDAGQPIERTQISSSKSSSSESKSSSSTADNSDSSTANNDAGQVAPAQQTAQTPQVANTMPTGDWQQDVLNQMTARTGVDQGTWNAIITRESNWDPYIYNTEGSGAYGLFQNVHGIGGADIQTQIDAAVGLYQNGGLGHWGY